MALPGFNSMNRYLCFLLALLIVSIGHAANFPDTSTDLQVIVNSNNVSAGSASFRWSFTDNRLTVGPTGLGSRVNVEGATPAWRLYAGGNPAASFSRLEGFWDSGAQTYYLREMVSGSNAIPLVVGINSGATLTFNTDGTATHSGGLGLSAQTNRLTIVNNALLLDGIPIGGTSETNVNNNFYTTNVFFVTGKGNTLIITQALTLNYVKTNLLSTDANGLVTTTKFGANISWDPATQTISASGGGDTTGTNVVTLTQTGTNLTAQMDFSLVQNGGVFKIVLTNNLYVSVPTSVATTPFRKAWFMAQQPSTGTCYINFTNGFFAYSEGSAPVNDTNAGSVTIYEMVSDVFTNGLVHLSMVAKSKLITNSIP